MGARLPSVETPDAGLDWMQGGGDHIVNGGGGLREVVGGGLHVARVRYLSLQVWRGGVPLVPNGGVGGCDKGREEGYEEGAHLERGMRDVGYKREQGSAREAYASSSQSTGRVFLILSIHVKPVFRI